MTRCAFSTTTEIESGVSFENSPSRAFDLVVGADGLHSQVRRLAFGPDQQFVRYQNMLVSVFDVAGYRPRDELVAIMHAEVWLPGGTGLVA